MTSTNPIFIFHKNYFIHQWFNGQGPRMDFVPPDTLSVSVLKFKVCVVDVSSANSNEAELVLDPSPATIGIPPGVTPSEILSVLSPLGLAS